MRKFGYVVRRIVISVAVLYFGALTFLYFFQDSLIFQGKALDANYTFSFEDPFEEVVIPVEPSINISGILFRSTEAKGLVIYFHGNRDNLQRWGHYASDFTGQGYNILMIDYRGYGKSGGVPSEEVLYADADKVWLWASEKLSPSRVIIYGRSLGSAVASHLAGSVNPDLLILETPFDELRGTQYAVVRNLLSMLPSKQGFSNKEHLPDVKCPIVIFQGTKDWVVPMSSAEKLKSFLKPADEFIVVEGGEHNDLRDFESYREGLKRVLGNVKID